MRDLPPMLRGADVSTRRRPQRQRSLPTRFVDGAFFSTSVCTVHTKRPFHVVSTPSCVARLMSSESGIFVASAANQNVAVSTSFTKPRRTWWEEQAMAGQTEDRNLTLMLCAM